MGPKDFKGAVFYKFFAVNSFIHGRRILFFIELMQIFEYNQTI